MEEIKSARRFKIIVPVLFSIGLLAGCGSGEPDAAAATPSTLVPIPDSQTPTVPTGLVSSAVHSSSVDISWAASTDNVAVTGYKIYRNGTQAGTSTTLTFSDSGLSRATTYSYTVAAYDAAGNLSAPSAALSVTTLSASTSAITVIQSFDGMNGPAYSDHPDLGGAVGPNHVVDFVGSSFTVHDKKTGAVVMQITQNQFWTNVGVSPETLLDPRLVYDPLA